MYYERRLLTTYIGWYKAVMCSGSTMMILQCLYAGTIKEQKC